VQPIVIAAGGTGGHFFPAEALAATLIARGERVVLMTDARSGGLKSAVFAGRETHVLPGAGIAGRGLWRGIKAVVGLAAGVIQARRLLARLNAAAVVGFGGYPSVGPVLGASLLRHGPSVVLHEQNGVLGRANRFLASRAQVLALSLTDTRGLPPRSSLSTGPARPGHDEDGSGRGGGPLAVVTGNPVRPAIAALADVPYAPPETDIRLLILGGSLGARVFSDVVPAALAALPIALRNRLRVTQQCRAEDLDRVRAAYATSGIAADLSPFFADVADRLGAAHLVIARAGASTVAEIAVAGRPSILVPLPGAIDDHQTANARALSAAGAARLMPQPEFTPDALTTALAAMLSDATGLTTMANAARAQARPDAATRLADLVQSLVHQKAERQA
jgi:UDP-N-acetylglucosamine--N-acetylmuramyl-(pentapeptide) pyrophosphoryl-undecaprenol N-acetylglucosamine transferase